MTITLCKTPLAIASFLAAALCASTSQAQGTWSAGTPFPTTVVRAAGVWFAPNSHFYAMGGRATDTAGSDFMNPYEYDPVAATWTMKAAAFPDNQNNNMAAGVLVDAGTSYIFCIGGSAASATSSTNAVRRYDPVADAITVVATDPWSGAPANTLAGGGAVYNNKLYVLGGDTATQRIKASTTVRQAMAIIPITPPAASQRLNSPDSRSAWFSHAGSSKSAGRTGAVTSWRLISPVLRDTPEG